MSQRDELLYQLALLYYEENLTQTEIAKHLKLSRPTVGSMLKEARHKGIVKITVTPRSSLALDQAGLLMNKFNLQTVVITPKEKSSYQSKINVGKACAEFIEQTLPRIKSIGIGWGTTMFEMVQALKPLPFPSLNIVPMMGGSGVDYTHLHSNHLAFRMADKFQASIHYYYAPAIAESVEVKQALDNSLFIKKIKQKALRVDLAVSSVGNPDRRSTYCQLGFISPDEVKSIRKSGAVGDILASLFDENGDPVQTQLSDKMIGVTLEELEMMNEVCIIASGEHKAHSLLILLKKGCVDHLIIDQPIADYLLAQNY